MNISTNDIIRKPRITEKATLLNERANAYVFNVSVRATKSEIAKAVKALYKVTPIRVNVTQIKRKYITVKGKRGVTGGGKKAVVYLKKGETITLM